MKQKLSIALLTALVCSFIPGFAGAQTVNPAFNPNKLIEDRVFSDMQTFGGSEGIQKFLESKQSVLANTSPAFLAKLKEPDTQSVKTALEDPQPNLGRLRTAAELIWDAARSSGLNPQVILVILNKEQGLITSRSTATESQLQRALDNAMGFGCPVATGCGELFPGFYYQMFGNIDSAGNRYLGATKSLMKSFTTPGGRGPLINGKISKVGDSITIDNSMGAYEGITQLQTVTLENQATAALYRYTPHVFNGNYNFWKFFNEWFKYANGTIIKLANESNSYIIQNGSRQLIPAFVAQARGVNISNALTVSPNEIEGYPIGKVYGPADNTIVTISGNTQPYVFVNNKKHPASSFVLSQRGLNAATAITISQTDADMFETGPQLTPKDGSVVRGQTDQAVYLVEGGMLKLFSAFTFGQRKAAQSMQVIPDAEIASYTKQGFVAPLDGTPIKGTANQTVYLIENGLKRPLTAELFRNRGITAKQVVILSDDEVGGITVGGFATPKDQTFFQVSGDGLYIFKEGTKHPISSFVAAQRRITPDYTFGVAEALTWQDGIPIPPKDGTIIKGSGSATVYLVNGGQLKPLTAEAFKNRRITVKQISMMAQAEVDAYAKGDALLK
jgi:hypothetical protein